MNMNTEAPTLLPEVAKLEKRQKRTQGLINPDILQSPNFLNSPEVIELQEIKEKIGLLGGKLNPVEMVTIDNVAAQKTRFFEVFGTDDESGVVFSYEKTKANATAALKEGLISLVQKAKPDEQMPFKAEDVEAMSPKNLILRTLKPETCFAPS